MKRLLYILPLLIVLLIPGTAFAVDYKDNKTDFNVTDYPMPYQSPSGYTNYIMSWVEGTSWTLYYVDSASGVDVRGSEGSYDVYIKSGTVYDKFTASIKKDTTFNKYYVADWVLVNTAETSSGFGCYYDKDFYGTYISVPWFSFDLYTQSGNFFVDSNPWPALPLVNTLDLAQLPEAVGGMAQKVIPVCLAILSILLLMALIRYLLHSWTLRKN